jgi:hypothetical protein
VSDKDEVTFALNKYEKGTHKSEIFCSKCAKTKNLWCQEKVTSSCSTLVFVSQNPKVRKN